MQTQTPSPAPIQWHQLDIETVAKELASDASAGLPASEAKERLRQFGGNEIVASTRRLALMNLFLHNIGVISGESMISAQDALIADSGERFDYVLANPPYFDPAKRYIGNAVQVFFKDGSSTDKMAIDYPIGHRERRQEGIPVLKRKFEASLSGKLAARQ